MLLHIDTGDTAMAEAVAFEQNRRRFTLRTLSTNLVKGYATLWKPLNPLFAMTHPEAYFIVNVSDEFLFLTQEWDTLLQKYIGYYPDHIFRLRASQYRSRNYNDFWECGFAPDSIAFYTRRWLELSGDWCPCLGPDSFQQCIAFYLYTSGPLSTQQFSRDIAVRELRFSGEGISAGLEGRALNQRTIINNRAWFILMSHAMQEEARRRAMRLKSHIIAHQVSKEATISEQRAGKYFLVASEKTGVSAQKIFYGLSWWRITATNIARIPFLFYYLGDRRQKSKSEIMFGSLVLMLATYAPSGVMILEKALQWSASLRQKLRSHNVNAPALSHHKEGPSKQVLPFNAWDNIAAPASDPETSVNPTVFSFQLPLVTATHLSILLDTIEATAAHPEYVEVLVPESDAESFAQEQARRKLRLRPIRSSATNECDIRNTLFNYTHPQAYFVVFLNEANRFETQGWDSTLLNYLSAWPDHIFRLRASAQRFRNYSSIQECLLAPDTVTFYTRRWLAIQGMPGPCSNLSAFQQCVSYYLFTSDAFVHAPTYRELALPFFTLSGETDAMPEEATLLSPQIQQEAKRRAMKLKASITYHACLAQLPDKPLSLLDDTHGKTVLMQSPDGDLIKSFSYR